MTKMKLSGLLMLVALSAFVGMTCQNGQGPLDSGSSAAGQKSSTPAEATLDSVILNIYVVQPNTQVVNVHMVTAAWDEAAVTWTSLAGAFDAAISASFSADSTGWHLVDITALVQSWLDGTYDNFGFLLDQVELVPPRAAYLSRESQPNQPFVQFCYTVGDNSTCENVPADADASIWEGEPEQNNGTSPILFSGWQSPTDLESQTLMRFEFPPMQSFGAVGDYVWNDENTDGIQDAEESGIPDVTVNLYDCAETFQATATTDADGLYLFEGLAPGDYYLEFLPPAGYLFSPQGQGTDAELDSDVDPGTGLTECLTLDTEESNLSYDAGMYMLPIEGCTRSLGYWKNHAGFGPQPDTVTSLLPIWLGTADNEKSIAVTDVEIAVNILKMKTYGDPPNGITKLYAQLLAAKLNIATPANSEDVEDVIADADAFLAEYDWEDWGDLSMDDRQMVLDWKDTLDQYNNGMIGPGHCDDEDDDNDDDDGNKILN